MGSLWMIGEIVEFADLHPQALAIGVSDDLHQGDGHGEDHEDVNHLHVGGGRKVAGDSDVAGMGMMLKMQHCQRCICFWQHIEDNIR